MATAVPLRDFLPLIRGRIIGCPSFILENAAREACIEFCTRTHLLTQFTDVITTVGDSFIELLPDVNLHYDLLSLSRGSQALRPSTRANFLASNLFVQTGTPQYYYMDGDTQIVVGPVPDTSETLSAILVVRPTTSATTVSSVLYDHYKAVIAAGARAWVRRNYGDWVDPALEAQDRKIFELAVFNANIRRNRGSGGASLRASTVGF